MPEQDGPLSGIRVVEIGTLIAAPFASRILGEFGADVIKIESREGDPLRKWRKMRGDTSLWWYVQSRNKRLMTVDLKSPEGQRIVRKLLATADVLVENYRPGALEKLGLGWEQLHEISPKLIMVRISGYGQTGPLRGKPGFGAIGEAMGGIRYTTGSPDQPPSRTGISIGDSLASLHAVIGALMALLHVKTKNGNGQVVDVSLVESVFNVMESIVPEFDQLGHVRERTGGKLPGICPSNTYQTSDDAWIVIAGNSDAIFKRLMIAIGRSDLADDARLKSNDVRVLHEDEIDAAIASWSRTRPLTNALALLDQADVPAGRIYSAADIVTDPHYLARDMILTATLPDGGEIKVPGVLPKLSETPGAMNWLGRELGADTHDILGELGYSSNDIAQLQASKTI